MRGIRFNSTYKEFLMSRLLSVRSMLSLTVLAALFACLPLCSAQEADDFSVVILPDTQYYSETYHDTYPVQTQWIADIAEERNLACVLHVGDLVQNPSVEDEWKVASAAHEILDAVDAPYCLAMGNHDGLIGDRELYNKYFPPSRLQRPLDNAWYGGNRTGENDSNFTAFRAGEMDFLVICLEYDPSAEVLEWAGHVAKAHPNHRAIVVTHAYMSGNGRNAVGNRVWDGLISQNPNIFMVVCGHISTIAHQESINESGGTVHEILCDYQGRPNGGDGWLQTMRFIPSEDKIEVESYSPKLDESQTEEPHQYTLEYDMTGE
jgi:hypothetical protein